MYDPIVVILAGGRGVRLHLLTQSQPKTLIKIAGRSLFDRFLEAAKLAHISQLVVATPSRDEALKEVAGKVTGVDFITMRSRDYIEDLETVLVTYDQHDVVIIEADNLMPPRALADFLRTPPRGLLMVSALALKTLHARGIPINQRAIYVEPRQGSWCRISRTVSAPTHMLAGCFSWSRSGVSAFCRARSAGKNRMGEILDHIQENNEQATSYVDFPAAMNLNIPQDVAVAEAWASEPGYPFDD